MVKTIDERVQLLEKRIDVIEDLSILEINTSIEKIKRMESILESLGYVILIPHKIKNKR